MPVVLETTMIISM